MLPTPDNSECSRHIPALSREELQNLGARFALDGAFTMPDGELRRLLKLKAEEFRTLKAQLDAVKEGNASTRNLKAAAQHAIERGDLDEAETLLSRVYEVEMEAANETARVRAETANLMGRVSQSDQISNNQLMFIKKSPAAASATLKQLANTIEESLEEFRRRSGLNTSPEDVAFTAIAVALRSIAYELDHFVEVGSEISALHATIEAQRQEIERLTRIIAAESSTHSQVFVAALGGAGATAIVAGAGYIFGPSGAQIIDNLWNLFGGLGQAPLIDRPPHNPTIDV